MFVTDCRREFYDVIVSQVWTVWPWVSRQQTEPPPFGPLSGAASRSARLGQRWG